MGWNYAYNYFGENTGRVTYAQNLNEATLDRSFQNDAFGRLQKSYSGSAARAHVGIGGSWASDGPYAMENNVYDVWGNPTSRTGWGGDNPSFTVSYVNNKRVGPTYDAAGNLIYEGGISYTYDVTGQQATASYTGYQLQQYYDGDERRAKKVDGSDTVYYLRSSVLGGQVVCELTNTGTWNRGYVYLGGQLLAVQSGAAVSWVHQDPFVKSKRVTNASGTVISSTELDPWGGNTGWDFNGAFQPQKFNGYIRDSIGADDAMFRRYNRWWSRFDQPDPYDGSYDLSNPQSFNRYSYVNNDPVNLVDPTGLVPGVCPPEMSGSECLSSWNPVGGGPINPFDRQSPTPTSVSGGNTGRQTIGTRYFAPVHIGYSFYDELTNTIRFYTFAQRWRPDGFGGFGLMSILGQGNKPPKTGPRDPGPTVRNVKRELAEWRARKLPECLKEANATYNKLNDQFAESFVNFFAPLSITSSLTSGLFVGLTSGLTAAAASNGYSLAGSAALAYAYSLPQLYVLHESYERDVRNCNSMYGPRR